MKKTRRTRETKQMVQTAIWLPREMHERLKKVRGDRAMAEEIRRRVQESFVAETHDEKTRDLLNGIENLATGAIAIDGAWHQDPYLFKVFRVGVDTLLTYFEPKMTPAAQAEAEKHFSVFNPDDPPEIHGRLFAHSFISDLKKAKG